MRWTETEDSLIRQYYPSFGGRWSGWAKLMPERMPTYDDVIHRARALGVRCEHKFRYGKGKPTKEFTAQLLQNVV